MTLFFQVALTASGTSVRGDTLVLSTNGYSDCTGQRTDRFTLQARHHRARNGSYRVLHSPVSAVGSVPAESPVRRGV
jgi:hypothetical protein